MLKHIAMIWVVFTCVSASDFGVMVFKNRATDKMSNIESQLQSLATENIKAFNGAHSMKIFLDRDRKFERDFSKNRKKAVLDFCQTNNLNVLNVVTVKSALRLLKSTSFLANESQAARTSSLVYNRDMSNHFTDMVLSQSLKLFFELGVLNDKKYY